MKVWTYLLLVFIMITSCSSSSESQKLTWYNNASINNILEDPDKPEEVVRVAIGISAQVFYISKKSSNYKNLIEKANLSFKKGKTYNIGVDSKTNMVKEINEVK
ncbi:hypothetical protein H3Z85_15035 [Chryseobacterium indologenes]|uniref:hypothetical protein n=1 Tax=Chryseobacterium indologenes TaxID=253 RepID=UPI0003E07EB6|nr:hypothetical protein [Chryseobacterium indologenes]QPQ50726.1 hypothetical protein H3Z85_15035 [Chryseobacterium indologenes]GAE62827.1 hypothetical protein CIN01S_01_00480 [Chryseobacterium indologenes NBRC 14944]SFJ22213.1 hypothetical protein SAMN05421692_1414 [Chryseobacterium indologenes]SUX53435.1 Uncharacterised protein [Chryseobacterium indologenes]